MNRCDSVALTCVERTEERSWFGRLSSDRQVPLLGEVLVAPRVVFPLTADDGRETSVPGSVSRHETFM